MLSSPDNHEELDEIHELNRVFLSYLKQRMEVRGDALELPAAALAALALASSAVLDRAAQFPRALFRLRFESWASWSLMDPAPTAIDPAQQAVQLTLLISASHLSRRSAYAARLFLGLTDAEVRRLRESSIGDLHRMALSSYLVGCAFAETNWLWPELLRDSRPEHRRQLSLIALQPNVAASDAARPPENTPY
jgi:hypothetical protein